MTEIEKIDEAIEYLTEMARYGMPDVKCASIFELALCALREKRERERPVALTIEQLEEMVRPLAGKGYEPVWIQTLLDGKVSCQMTVGLIQTDYRYKPPRRRIDAHWVNLDLVNYGKTWLAYAHRPGGVEG